MRKGNLVIYFQLLLETEFVGCVENIRVGINRLSSLDLELFEVLLKIMKKDLQRGSSVGKLRSCI